MILSIHYKIYPEKKLIPSSTYITILVKSLIDLIFLSNFVLVFKMSLYYNVLDSLIHLTPARSGAMVVFSGETAETLESQGRARDWVSQETMSLSSWSTYFSRASFSGSRIYFEGVELKKLRNDKVILGRTTEKKIFGRKLQESGFGVKQGIYHSLEQSKTGAGSGLPVAEAKQNWAVSQQFLNWVGGCI